MIPWAGVELVAIAWADKNTSRDGTPPPSAIGGRPPAAARFFFFENAQEICVPLY
jgi:hypothetical protein